MKIGLALYGSLEERSGGFRYDRKLAEGLRAAGDTVELVELPWRAYHRGLLDNVSRRLRERLRIDVDVMLQDELAHPSLLYLNRHLPFPIVSIVHHLRSSESRRLAPFYRIVEQRYFQSVDGVICNSTATRDVVTDIGVDPDVTVVAPPAGDRMDGLGMGVMKMAGGVTYSDLIAFNDNNLVDLVTLISDFVIVYAEGSGGLDISCATGTTKGGLLGLAVMLLGLAWLRRRA